MLYRYNKISYSLDHTNLQQIQNINNKIDKTNVITDTSLTNTNDLLIPSSKCIKTYIDNQINAIPSKGTIGQGINYFFTNQNHPTLSNYEYINPYPDTTAQDIEFVDCQNNEVLIGSYITNNFNRLLLNRGVFQFYFYASVDDISNYSYISVEIYKRIANGTETLILNNIKSNDINTVYPNNNMYIAEGTITSDIILLNTDEIVIKIYGGTNITDKLIRIYFYHGGNTNSYFTSSLITKHNELVNIQGGSNNEYYHLTNQQYINATSIVSTNNSGILDTTLFNTFNNKQNNLDNNSNISINSITLPNGNIQTQLNGKQNNGTYMNGRIYFGSVVISSILGTGTNYNDVTFSEVFGVDSISNTLAANINCIGCNGDIQAGGQLTFVVIGITPYNSNNTSPTIGSFNRLRIFYISPNGSNQRVNVTLFVV